MTDWTPEAMRRRVARYGDLAPCRNAFVDARTPGSAEKENFAIIGPGVSENPNQRVHIREPHGFNVGGARQPAGCLNSQHSHRTAEVFVVHSGRWRFLLGVDADDARFDLGPCDVVSMPVSMFRGFEKLDDGRGFLWAVLGGDDPGRVTWAPRVFELAARHGLVLLKGGRLVDTAAGETVPPGAEIETPPTAEQVAAYGTPPMEKLAACIAGFADLAGNPASPLAADGVEECPVITPQATGDGFAPGPIEGWWPHGFNLRCLKMRANAATPFHARGEPEVLFAHRGAVEVAWAGGSLTLRPGDTMTVPVGLPRAFRAAAVGAVVYVVRGGDAPAAPTFADREAA